MEAGSAVCGGAFFASASCDALIFFVLSITSSRISFFILTFARISAKLYPEARVALFSVLY